MKLIDTILVALDFHRGWRDVVRMAAHLAKQFGSRVGIVHVLPDTASSPLAARWLRRQITELLKRVRQEFAVQRVPLRHTALECGEPVQKILERAGCLDADLILLGAGTKSAPFAGGFGETARRLLACSRRPLWLVRHGTPPLVRSILCPVDFTEGCGRAIHNAVHIAHRLEASLTIVTTPEPSFGKSRTSGDAGTEHPTATPQSQRVPDRLERLLREVDLRGVAWRALAPPNESLEETLNNLPACAADLLVLGLNEGPQADPFSVERWEPLGAVRAAGSLLSPQGKDVISPRLEEPTDPLDQYRSGRELLEHGFAREAIRHLERCLAAEPTHSLAWAKLADAHARLGDQLRAQLCREHARQAALTVTLQRLQAEHKNALRPHRVRD